MAKNNITVRIDPADREALMKKAKEMRIGLSTYVRLAAIEYGRTGGPIKTGKGDKK